MLYIELHKRDSEEPIQVNPGAILFYEPYDKYCKLWMYYGRDTLEVTVNESYNEVKSAFSTFEFINNEDWVQNQVSTALYIDFLHHEKRNILRDEYLRWKGKNKLISKSRYINADELLEHIGRDQLDTREKIINLVESLVARENIENEHV